MHSYKSKLTFPRFYNLKTTCHSHGWKNLAPFSWHENDQSLLFSLFVCGEPIGVKVRQDNNQVNVDAVSHVKLNAEQKALLNSAVARSLDLHTDTTELYKLARSVKTRYGSLVANGAGRILKAPSLWEDAAKTLFTTNCSWALTKNMCNLACSRKFSVATPLGVYPFPLREKISRATAVKLKNDMRVGYRAAYLKQLAISMGKSHIEQEIQTMSENEVRKYFSGISGFGSYATNHLMLLCGYFNEIPIDSMVKTYIKNHYHTEKYSDFIDAHYGQWGMYKWWGMKLEQIANKANWLGD